MRRVVQRDYKVKVFLFALGSGGARSVRRVAREEKRGFGDREGGEEWLEVEKDWDDGDWDVGCDLSFNFRD